MAKKEITNYSDKYVDTHPIITGALTGAATGAGVGALGGPAFVLPAALAGAASGVISAPLYQGTMNARLTRGAYNQFHDAYSEAGLDNIDLTSYITTLYTTGELDLDTYKDAMDVLDKFEKQYADKDPDVFFNVFKTTKTHKATAKLYEAMTHGVASFEEISKLTPEELKERLTQGVADVANNLPGVATPNYNPVDMGDIASFPIGERKLWTGAELAELNDTNWDPEHYYNLIKKGTSAALDEARFLQAQADAASTINNTAEGASYLDALRNIKSEAISAGATRGARAAAEILQANEATNNFATAQRELATTSNEAMRTPLLEDASARLTAREYFDSLAQDRYQQAMTYYMNDTDAVGQQILTDAELYGADINARAQAAYANAQMNRAYTEAQAAIGAAKSAVNNVANEYAWLFDRYNDANGGDVAKTYSDITNYLFNSYTGGNIKNFVNNLN